MKSQKQVWDNIAPLWSKYRNKPSPTTIEFLKNKKGKLLDIGCGSGRNFTKKQNLQIYGIDFSEKMLEFAKEKKIAKQLKLMQNQEIPYPNNFFDSAICVAILHCIKTKKNRTKLLKELNRTLKPGSKALVSVWGRESPRLKNKPKECHIPWKADEKQLRYTYIYNKTELEKELKQAGFKIIKGWEEQNVNFIVEK